MTIEKLTERERRIMAARGWDTSNKALRIIDAQAAEIERLREARELDCDETHKLKAKLAAANAEIERLRGTTPQMSNNVMFRG